MIPCGHGDGTIATEPDQHGRDEEGHSNWFSAKGDRGSGHFLKDALWGGLWFLPESAHLIQSSRGFSGGGSPDSIDTRNLGSRNSKPIHMAGVCLGTLSSLGRWKLCSWELPKSLS